MSALPTRLAPSLLGLFGGSLGLLFFYEIIDPSLDLSACSCGWNAAEALAMWPVALGSLVGLLGCLVVLYSQHVGGALLVGGGLIASSTIVYAEFTKFLFGPLTFYLAPNLFFGLLLILGGLLAFPKTRHVIKMLHDGGWIP